MTVGPLDPIWQLTASLAKVRPSHCYHLFCALSSNPKLDPEAFALYANLEVKHIQSILQVFAARGMLPTRAKNFSDNKGSRLPADFRVPDEWIMTAREKRRWSDADAREEAESFVGYWATKVGKDACKLDWRLTWGNWVRNSRRPNGQYSPAAEPTDRRAHLERTIEIYERMGRQEEARDLRLELERTNNVFPLKAVG